MKTIGRLTAMMMLALAVSSCEHAELPTDPNSSAEFAGEPQELLGLDGGLLGGLTGGEIRVRAIDQDGRIRTYTLVQEPITTSLLNTVVGTVNGLVATVTELIGVDGGTLNLLGHRLKVPANAVDRPTLFSLSVPLSGRVEVDLTATAPGASGLIDVGEEGFNRLVRLDMTYERATNVRDADDLVILRMNPAGLDALHEVMSTTVDKERERATTWLEHFSGYTMGF